MTATYVPYSEVAPRTTNLRALRSELDRVRDVYGPGSSQGAEAYNRLSHEAGRQGQPLDGLRRESRDETERFFAQVVPGPDGHHYWDGGRDFTRNDGKKRTPARWWWEHVHGEIGTTTRRVVPTCGDLTCIDPAHAICEHFNVTRRRTDEQLLGALQVMAMRLGYTPSQTEWELNGGTPTPDIFRSRFGGTWENVCRAAHLEPIKLRRIARTK